MKATIKVTIRILHRLPYKLLSGCHEGWCQCCYKIAVRAAMNEGSAELSDPLILFQPLMT